MRKCFLSRTDINTNMGFKHFFHKSLFLEDFDVITEGMGDNQPLPARNLTMLANKVLNINPSGVKPDETHPVRRERQDDSSQVVVQFLVHFMQRVKERNIDLMVVINGLTKFVEQHLNDLANTFNKANHVEGIVRINLPQAVENEEGDMSSVLNIPFRYSTFGVSSPKKHVLTFITAKVKDNFVQNAPPIHGETVNKDFTV